MVDESSVSTNTFCGICSYFLCCCKCLCFRNKCKRYIDEKIYRSSNEILFGDLIQCRLIMEKNFEGKQFIIDDGSHLPKIDCMFFPST